MAATRKRDVNEPNRRFLESRVRTRSTARHTSPGRLDGDGKPDVAMAALAVTEGVDAGEQFPSAAHDPTAEEGEDATLEDARDIELLLDGASERLLRMTDARRRQELSLVVERYRIAVRQWANDPPTPLQRAILRDCVEALHRRVISRFREPPAW